MTYLFKKKGQGISMRIEFSEDELNKSSEDVFIDFNSKGKFQNNSQNLGQNYAQLVQTVHSFHSAYAAFDIKNKESLFMKLVDRDGDGISGGELAKLLRQYKMDSTFMVEMVFSSGIISALASQVHSLA